MRLFLLDCFKYFVLPALQKVADTSPHCFVRMVPSNSFLGLESGKLIEANLKTFEVPIKKMTKHFVEKLRKQRKTVGRVEIHDENFFLSGLKNVAQR
jgi:hypothetical protein